MVELQLRVGAAVVQRAELFGYLVGVVVVDVHVAAGRAQMKSQMSGKPLAKSKRIWRPKTILVPVPIRSPRPHGRRRAVSAAGSQAAGSAVLADTTGQTRLFRLWAAAASDGYLRCSDP